MGAGVIGMSWSRVRRRMPSPVVSTCHLNPGHEEAAELQIKNAGLGLDLVSATSPI